MKQESRRGLEVHEAQEGLCELFVVVRPEDKSAVSRIIEGEPACEFIAHHALGRGCEGGFAYGGALKPFWAGLFNRTPRMEFLPKIVFWAVLERSAAEGLIEKIGAALRLGGGPAQCAGGFAIVAEIEHETPMGLSPGTGVPARAVNPGVQSGHEEVCAKV